MLMRRLIAAMIEPFATSPPMLLPLTDAIAAFLSRRRLMLALLPTACRRHRHA